MEAAPPIAQRAKSHLSDSNIVFWIVGDDVLIIVLLFYHGDSIKRNGTTYAYADVN